MVYTLVVHLHAKEGEENLSKLKAKLAEASQVYSKDKETLGWYVILCVCEISTVVICFEKKTEKNWKERGEENVKVAVEKNAVLCCANRSWTDCIALADFF